MLHDIVMKDAMVSYKKQGLFILRIGFLYSEEHEFIGVQVNRRININSSWKFMIELKKKEARIIVWWKSQWRLIRNTWVHFRLFIGVCVAPILALKSLQTNTKQYKQDMSPATNSLG
jgi:hypothetical protein